MTTASTSCITAAEERIRDMLANCTSFISWTGEANAAAAKTHIYYDAAPRPDTTDTSLLEFNQFLRPFAVVWTATSNGFALNESLGASGVVMVRFEQDVPTTTLDDYEEADRLFKNTLGDIILSEDSGNPGLWELSITRQYTQIIQITLDALYRTTEDEYTTYGNAQAAEISIRWGVAQ